MPVEPDRGPFRVEVELLYQPIGFRWARNVAESPSAETTRFGDAFATIADRSATALARAESR